MYLIVVVLFISLFGFLLYFFPFGFVKVDILLLLFHTIIIIATYFFLSCWHKGTACLCALQESLLEKLTIKSNTASCETKNKKNYIHIDSYDIFFFSLYHEKSMSNEGKKRRLF